MTATLTPPSTDLTPVQRAVVCETAGLFEPELFLEYHLPLPGGGIRLWYAWTAGGAPLGDRADDAALARGLDCADYIGLANPHSETTQHGRVQVIAYKVRPILTAVHAGERGPRQTREALARLFTDVTGQEWTADDRLDTWWGVGPRQVTAWLRRRGLRA